MKHRQVYSEVNRVPFTLKECDQNLLWYRMAHEQTNRLTVRNYCRTPATYNESQVRYQHFNFKDTGKQDKNGWDQ